MPVNIGPAPALETDVGSETVKSCSSARAEVCAGGQLPASQRRRLNGFKYLIQTQAKAVCGTRHEGTAHANIAGTSFIRFLEQGQWHFLLRGLALAPNLEAKQNTEHLKKVTPRNARTKPRVQGHSTPLEKSCLWHEQLLHEDNPFAVFALRASGKRSAQVTWAITPSTA